MKRLREDIAWLCTGVLLMRFLDDRTHLLFALAGVALLAIVFLAIAERADDR